VEFSGLPSTGSWKLARLPDPDQVIIEGSGSGYKVTGLPGGVYTYTVTNSYGCTSEESDEVIISTPGKPDLIVTDPPAVCYPATVNLTNPEVTAGSTAGLTFTYWSDAEATLEYDTPASATAGTYYIKGTTVTGFFNIKPVEVRVVMMPQSNAGPEQELALEFSTTLAAELGDGETGTWIINSGKGIFTDINDPTTVIENLSYGTNILSWIVTNGICPADTGKVHIIVGDIKIPTLITPNGDTRNEYFIITGLEALGETEFIVFDRRGAQVFKNSDYDNKWNGVDYNEKPLPNDTYFYVLKTVTERSYSGYIVIRR
jgi:gliding motility-associated-like protein